MLTKLNLILDRDVKHAKKKNIVLSFVKTIVKPDIVQKYVKKMIWIFIQIFVKYLLIKITII